MQVKSSRYRSMPLFVHALRKQVLLKLDDDENLQGVFLAQTGPNPNLISVIELILIILGLIGFVIWHIFFRAMVIKYWAIAITNKRIVIFRVNSFTSTVKESVDSFPRDTDLNVSDALWGWLMLGEQRYWINRVYHEDINEAIEVDSASIIKEKLRSQNKGNQKEDQDEASTFEIQANR